MRGEWLQADPMAAPPGLFVLSGLPTQTPEPVLSAHKPCLGIVPVFYMVTWEDTASVSGLETHSYR